MRISLRVIKWYTVCYLCSWKHSFAVYISPDGSRTSFIVMIAVMTIATVAAFLVSYNLGKKGENKG